MLLDWLECTFKGDILSILSQLHSYFISWDELDFGQMFYDRSAVVWETGRVFWSTTRTDMGVHVRLPPSAIQSVGLSSDTVFRDLYFLGAKFSRLDIAADDFEGHLSIPVIREKCLAHELVTRARFVDEYGGLIGRSGRTISIGQRGSGQYMRIYDKSAEQAERHEGVYTHWVRCELELRGDKAQAAAIQIIRNPDCWRDLARGWFMQFLDFKVVGQDTNKSRWASCGWWLAFLGDAAKIRLVIEKVLASVERTRRWIDRQAVPALYVLGQTIGYESLFSMVLEGKNRLRDMHEDMIIRYRLQQEVANG